MSVVIRGMKMPKNCKECPFCKWSNHYQIYVCFDGNRYTEMFFDGKYPTESALRSRRADNCPMTELHPHGRLIDADAIEIPKTNIDTFENCRNCRLLSKGEVEGIINAAPTIIEAEE